MALPASWTTVPVTWILIGQDGTPCNGRVRFSTDQTVLVDGKSFVPAPILVDVVNGVMAPVSLPATDDPDSSPTGWMWKVQAQTVPAGPNSFYISVPATSPEINLATVVPVWYPSIAPVPAAGQLDGPLSLVLANPNGASYAEVDRLLEERVQEVVEGHTPGSELAYAEMTTAMSNTTVFPTVPAVTPLALSVVGKGRPVEIEFFVSELVHSVANGGCAATIISQKNGGAVGYEQVICHYSPKTAFGQGPGLSVKRRKVLENGATYSFGFGLTGLVAGTWTAGGIANVRTMYSSVVAR